MKAKIVKRTLSLITVLALIFTLAVQGAGAIQSADVNKYPYVYVHGLFGWGADEGIDDTLPYWGSASCSLMDELNKAMPHPSARCRATGTEYASSTHR